MLSQIYIYINIYEKYLRERADEPCLRFSLPFSHCPPPKLGSMPSAEPEAGLILGP